MGKPRGYYVRGSSNVVLFDRQDIQNLYEEGCYGSSSVTSTLKPYFMRKGRKRFRDQDHDPNWVEPWKLVLVEAYYLLEKGDLDLYCHDDEGKEVSLSTETAWAEFSNVGSSTEEWFAVLYGAYRYFKGQGWVVKMGQTYGATFTLYQGDPDHNHSQFCVIVRSTENKQAWRWLDVTREARVANQTQKEVMLCEVTLTEPFSNPGCKAKTDSVALLRWKLQHEMAGNERKPEKKVLKRLLKNQKK